MIEMVHPFAEICAGIGAISIGLAAIAFMCQNSRIAGRLLVFAVFIIVLGTAGPIFLDTVSPIVLAVTALLLFFVLWKSLRSLSRGWK